MTIIKNKYFIITLILVSALIIGFGLMEIALSGGNGGNGNGDGDCPAAFGPDGEGFGGFDTSQGSSNSSNSDSGDHGGNGGGWDFPNEPSPPPPPPPPPPTVTLTTWPTFTIPELVSLYWSSANADSCTASADWSGAKPTQGEERFSKPSGNYSFTLTCTGPGGSASDSKNVKVIQVPQCSFTANPITIILPASSTLSWNCLYADSCSIDQGIGSVNNVSGTKDVRPSQTTTYTLNCSGLDGSRSSQATVSIGFEPTRREVPPY